jgi:hypothetical protein
MGAFVADEPRYGERPMLPATWSPAVESVAVVVQAAGSVAVDFQTFSRSVVGDVPVACARTLRKSPTA